MRFRIWTILWVFALLASAMATFYYEPVFGFLVAAYVLFLWSIIFEMTKRRGFTLVELLLFVAVSFMFYAAMFPAISRSYEGERATECRNSLSKIAKAVLVYQKRKGKLPPSTMHENNGGARRSWRVSILPYLDRIELFSRYDLSKAWDDAANKRVGKTEMPLYCCRNDDPFPSKTGKKTSYFAVTGPGTAWSTMFSENDSFSDNPSETILLIEQLEKGVAWSEPKDLTIADAVKLLTLPESSPQYVHMSCGEWKFLDKPKPRDKYRGFNVAFADGSVRYVFVPISKRLATALLTANGGEEISDAELKNLWTPELDYARIYSLGVFVLLSLLPIVKLRREC